MQNFCCYPLIVLLTFLVVSCEEEFIPEVITTEDNIVVEGYIEGGDQPTPPYVILTRSVPFFSELSTEQFNTLFINDADVTVFDGEQTVNLTEVCLDEIPPEFKDQVGAFLGITVDSIGINLCVYVDLTFSMLGVEGKNYDLRVETADKVLTASTRIPASIPLDSLYFSPPPGKPNDTLAQLRVFLDDPAASADYYRYFTREGEEGFQRPFDSVTDDLLFDGQYFEFPLTKAEPFGGDFDQETFGLFRRGEEATIKWMTIDVEHFNFWNTLEFSRSNQGPFSSYTRIDHNIEGGLGIWGGIAAKYYSILVEY
jgi:hypothetical protein